MKAMVLVPETYNRPDGSELVTTAWMDLWHRCRTLDGLRRKLRRGCRNGEWTAWRIIQIDEEGGL